MIEVVEDSAALARAAAARFACAFREAVADRGVFSVALAGGTTPRGMHLELCAPAYDSLPWGAIEVYFGDERCVPPDDPESNCRAARAALLDPRRIENARVRRIRGEADPEQAAAEYDALLPARLDLVVLGVGEDGHTASLFPGSPALREAVRRVVATEGPKPPRRRITVTPAVLAAARGLLVLVAGAGKSAAVARALEGPEDPLAIPAGLARRGDWVLDRAAAGGLCRVQP